MTMHGRAVVACVVSLGLVGCGDRTAAKGGPGEQPSSATAAASGVPAAPRARKASPVREGGALVRAGADDALYVADEDHGVVRIIPLPADAGRPRPEIPMPGPPAAVLALADRVIVTVRNPAMLVILRPEAETLVETGRVPLPPDAWGLAVTPDEQTAIVTSAWSGQVSAVDLASATKRWSVDVAREPRAVLVTPDGKTAYVSHLVGADLTRIDGIGATPSVRRIKLGAAPLRTPRKQVLAASLGYALASDGPHLFVSRHALGASGGSVWYGSPTVDVMLTADDTPLAPAPTAAPIGIQQSVFNPMAGPLASDYETALPGDAAPFPQPRAMVHRASTRTLIVASEGWNRLVELDATAIDPSVHVLKTFHVGARPDPATGAATSCGAPTGLALSADERTAYVFCRATYDLALVDLGGYDEPAAAVPRGPTPMFRLAEDPAPEIAAGRRLFYDATDALVSGDLACAGCHPDGRDDGFVYNEVGGPGDTPVFLAQATTLKGLPRQTPMLAGRVSAEGPYGWHAQNDTLVERLREGMMLHRWDPQPTPTFEDTDNDDTIAAKAKALEDELESRAAAIVPFLRRGLVPPPGLDRELTPDEQRGKAVFSSAEVGCAGCHPPATDYTHRIAVPLPSPGPRPGDLEEKNKAFKTPSLRFVGRTPPYFHDGRFETLEQVVNQNEDRMGKTSQLSEADRAALVAFLRTL
jgi:hypothetical protein